MKVYQLLSDKSKWTQHSWARDNNFRPVDPNGPSAVCWDLDGAVKKCYPPDISDKVYRKINHHLKQNEDEVISWNDKEGRTWEEVYSLSIELDI